MPSYGQTVTLQFVAWDTSANAPKTGDAANFTLKWVKDGTAATPTNVPATEVDTTNAKGIYKIVMTATECQCQVGTICGVSSTANIVILPLTVTFENLPTAALAASGGLPTVGTGSGQINLTSGGVDLQTIKTQSVTASGGVTFPASIGTSTYTGTDTSGTTTLLSRIPGAITLNAGMVEVDLQTIKGQSVTCAAGVTFPASIGTSTYAGADTAGTTTLLTRIPGIITLNSGNVACDLQTIKTQAVTAAAGVTFPASIQATTTFPANFSSLSIDSNGRVKIQGGITKNAALSGFEFYMALSSDHVSPATGKSVTATVSLNGGTFAGTTNSPVEIANGWYKVDLAAADLNGNVVALSFAATSCDTTQVTILTQP